MRFMMLMIPRGYEQAAPGTMPDAEAVAAFLIREARFPRAIAFCVHAAYQRLAAIRPPDAADRPGGASLARLHALDQLIARGDGELRGAAAPVPLQQRGSSVGPEHQGMHFHRQKTGCRRCPAQASTRARRRKPLA